MRIIILWVVPFSKGNILMFVAFVVPFLERPLVRTVQLM